MPANIANSRKDKADTTLRLLRRFVYAAAAIFTLAGLVMLYGAMDNVPPLRQPDAVFGLSTRAVLVVAGVLHLAVGGCLFALRDPMKQGLIVCWAGLNNLVYLAGVVWLKPGASLPAVVVLAWESGVSEKTVHIVWRLFIAYLVLVGLSLVILEWRHLKRLETEAFLKHWHEARDADLVASDRAGLPLISRCAAFLFGKAGRPGRPRRLASDLLKMSCPGCGGHIKFAPQNLSQKTNCPHCEQPVTLRPPDETLKMSCFFCHGHVQFPAHALGTKMPCPHCKMDITLKEPA